MEPSTIINGVAVALIVAVVLFGLNVRSALVRIETLLTGANGDNGLVGDMKQQRDRTHGLANDLNAVRGTVALHELRLNEWDRREGPEDRRVSA